MAISRDEVRFCLRCGTALHWVERYGVLRPVCPHCHYIHFFDPKVAAAVMVVRDGKLLMVQRAMAPQQGLWTVPGGYVDAGEDPAAGAGRECLEETGLAVNVGRLLGIVSGHNQVRGADFVIFYQAEVVGGALCASDDACAAGWFAPDALPPIAFEATREMVRRWLDGDLAL